MQHAYKNRLCIHTHNKKAEKRNILKNINFFSLVNEFILKEFW